MQPKRNHKRSIYFNLNNSLSLERNSPKIKLRLASYEWPEELRKRFQS